MLFKAIYYRNIRIEKAEKIQDDLDAISGALKKYKLKKQKYKENKENLLINAKKIYEGRQMIIDAFKNKIFPIVPTGFSEDKEPPRVEDEEEKKDGRLPTIEEEQGPIEEEPKEEVFEQITELDKFHGRYLIYKYFLENTLIKIIKKLKDYKKNPEKLQTYNDLIPRLNIGLKRLENDINNMSEDEVENKKIDYLRDLVRKIVDVSQKLDDMPDLETEEDAEKRQRGQGLKIMTPKEMITRLLILLAQLKAGNNSQKLKNEIRQLLYHLYGSKNLSKTIYNHLINII